MGNQGGGSNRFSYRSKVIVNSWPTNNEECYPRTLVPCRGLALATARSASTGTLYAKTALLVPSLCVSVGRDE